MNLTLLHIKLSQINIKRDPERSSQEGPRTSNNQRPKDQPTIGTKGNQPRRDQLEDAGAHRFEPQPPCAAKDQRIFIRPGGGGIG